MVSRLALGFVVAASAVLALTAARAAEEEAKKAEIKCPVSGQAADKEHAVAYKGGKVYFCCPNCPKAFEKETAKFATKANHQLVLTKQAEQKKCPISGRDLNKAQTSKVADVEVVFCCPNCKGKVDAADKKEQLELVFSDKAFDKAYEVKKQEKK